MTGVCSGSRRLRRQALEAVDVPEVGQVEKAVHLVGLALLQAHRRDELRAKARVHARLDLEAHHLAEAAAAELLLDGLEHVVGLVGDVVVGVAGDPEERVAHHLHPREERAEVGGDQVVEGHERVAVLAEREEAAQELLRHLDPREHVGVLLGIAQRNREAQREVRDVGEGPAQADHERGQRGEHLALEEGRELLALFVGGLGDRQDANAALLELGPHRLERRARALALGKHPLGDLLDLGGDAHPVRALGLAPGLPRVLEVRDAHHEELVEVRLPDRAELDPLEQRNVLVLGQLEDAVVELEPGELAVEVEGGVVERRRFGRPGAVGGRTALSVGAPSPVGRFLGDLRAGSDRHPIDGRANGRSGR